MTWEKSSLTSLDLRQNECDAGVKRALCDALARQRKGKGGRATPPSPAQYAVDHAAFLASTSTIVGSSSHNDLTPNVLVSQHTCLSLIIKIRDGLHRDPGTE